MQLFILHTGEKGTVQQLCGTLGALEDAPVHPAGVLRHRQDAADGIQGKTLLIAVKGDGEFFVYIAFKHAAKESVEAAVVLKDHILPCHRITPPSQTVIAAGTLPAAAALAPSPLIAAEGSGR